MRTEKEEQRMKNVTCKHIEIIIHEVESASPAVLANMKKRHWAYIMDGFLRAALLYGGKCGIAFVRTRFCACAEKRRDVVDFVLLFVCGMHGKRGKREILYIQRGQ